VSVILPPATPRPPLWLPAAGGAGGRSGAGPPSQEGSGKEGSSPTRARQASSSSSSSGLHRDPHHRRQQGWGAHGKRENKERGADATGELLQAQSGAAQKASQPRQGRAAERRTALRGVKGRQESRRRKDPGGEADRRERKSGGQQPARGDRSRRPRRQGPGEGPGRPGCGGRREAGGRGAARPGLELGSIVRQPHRPQAPGSPSAGAGLRASALLAAGAGRVLRALPVPRRDEAGGRVQRPVSPMGSCRRRRFHSRPDSAAIFFFFLLLLLLLFPVLRRLSLGSLARPTTWLRSRHSAAQPAERRSARRGGPAATARGGPSSPAPTGSVSASVTARPPSWFHLSLEARGLPASGGTGRPPGFKGPAAPGERRCGVSGVREGGGAGPAVKAGFSFLRLFLLAVTRRWRCRSCGAERRAGLRGRGQDRSCRVPAPAAGLRADVCGIPLKCAETPVRVGARRRAAAGESPWQSVF